jgi:hypothetical protein
MKWSIYWDLCTEAVSALHQVFADYSTNITDTATAVSYYTHSNLSSLSLQLYSPIQMIKS